VAQAGWSCSGPSPLDIPHEPLYTPLAIPEGSTHGGTSAITKAGRAQLKAETENWERIAGVIGRVLEPESGLAAVALAKVGS
jgi:hypothetical protein